jgi:hypothetical protein
MEDPTCCEVVERDGMWQRCGEPAAFEVPVFLDVTSVAGEGFIQAPSNAYCPAHAPADSKPIPVEADEPIVAGDTYGLSILQAAYRSYWLKLTMLRNCGRE